MTAGQGPLVPLVPVEDPDDPRIAAYRQVRERDLAGRQGQFIAKVRYSRGPSLPSIARLISLIGTAPCLRNAS